METIYDSGGHLLFLFCRAAIAFHGGKFYMDLEYTQKLIK